MFKINPLFLSRTTQHEKGDNSQHHTNPLIKIQPFAKHKHSSDKYHYRAGGINRPYDGNRQMLHPEITEYP